MAEGSTLIATVEDGRVVLEDRRAAARRLRGSWKRLVEADDDLVQGLLEIRAAEVALDDAEAAKDSRRAQRAHDVIARSTARQRGRHG